MPKVSIIVPNYNYARFLGQRLASIQAQSYRDFEVILLDDASTDASLPILERFASEHGCQLVCNAENSGSAYKQWNKGLRLASGKYVWIAEADDYADPRFLEVLVGRLEQNPRCGVAQCGTLRVDAAGNIEQAVLPTMHGVDRSRWRRDFIANGPEECVRIFLQENTIQNASAVVFKRELYERVAGVDESFRLCADWKFWASMLCLSDLAFVAEPLNYFRTHGNSIRSRTRRWEEVAEGLQVMRYILDTLDVPKDALQDLHARLAIVLLYAYGAQRPSKADLQRVREFSARLDFGFSMRAARGFARQCMLAFANRLHHGWHSQRDDIGTAVGKN